MKEFGKFKVSSLWGIRDQHLVIYVPPQLNSISSHIVTFDNREMAQLLCDSLNTQLTIFEKVNKI